MLRNPIVYLTAVAALTLIAGSPATAAVGHNVFYLSVAPRQCLIGSNASGNAGGKIVEVVPCSDPAHTLEVYAVGHGGWGHGTPPPIKTVLATMRSVCLSAFQRLTGHVLKSPGGWNGFAADPGAETARYGDKIICSYRTWPALRALGKGWHVR